jgi:hypothetical protein
MFDLNLLFIHFYFSRTSVFVVQGMAMDHMDMLADDTDRDGHISWHEFTGPKGRAPPLEATSDHAEL